MGPKGTEKDSATFYIWWLGDRKGYPLSQDLGFDLLPSNYRETAASFRRTFLTASMRTSPLLGSHSSFAKE
jgi:hypothetical protein